MAPSAPNAWLWGDQPKCSDITLMVYPAGDGPDGAWSDGKPEPVTTLALHALVLASVSPGYFRPRTHGDWQSGAETVSGEQEPAAKQEKNNEPQGPSAKVLELTCFPGEPHAVVEAVMCHAYAGTLPDEPSLLAQMIARADYLDMAATVEACLAKLKELSAAGQLTMQDVIALSSLPALQTEGSKAAVEQAVASISGKVLSFHLGSTRQVLLDQQLLDQLVQLPFPLFVQWARLESLKVDSENTMAVLITAWCKHQLSSDAAAAPTEQQCKELSTLICLNKLSLGFHLQAMPHLEWYHAPFALPTQHALARVLDPGGFRVALTSGGTARQQPGPAKAEQQWSLSRQQLETLWVAKELTLEGHIYFAGFNYSTLLELQTVPQPAGQIDQPPQPCYKLGVFLHVSWPQVLIDHDMAVHVPHPVYTTQVELKIAGLPSMRDKLTASDEGQGWENIAKRMFSDVEELVTFMAAREPCVKITLSDVKNTLSDAL